MRIALAILLYFGVVFRVGFLLGTIRVVWLEPRFGPIIATACEAPFLLMAMLVAARWVPRVLNTRRDPKTLMLVGIGALVADRGFHGGVLVAGYWSDRTGCTVPNRARKHLCGLAARVCNHAVGRQLLAGVS
jgi:hypothetical protein